MSKVLVSGSAGFIGGYVVQELLGRGPRGRRHRQLLEVRPGRAQLRRPPGVPARRGRRARRRAHDRAARRLRPLHRGRGDDRRDLVLPHVRVRPPRHERADHRGVVRRRDPRVRRRSAQEGHVPELVDGVRVGDVVAVVRRAGARGPAAALVVRLPEARGRVLRARRARPVRAAVHDRAAVQLRRRRRGARARRGRGAERQRQARDEPRRSRPRAEGAEGPGPAAHPRRRQRRSGTTPTAATWRAASSPRWSTRTR